MQYIPCNSALLAQEALFLPQKALFMPKDLQKKVRKSRQILILRQNSVCKGLKISSESKFFGEGPSRLRTTNAILAMPERQSFLFIDVFPLGRVASGPLNMAF